MNKPIQKESPNVQGEKPWGQPGGFGRDLRSLVQLYGSDRTLTLEELTWVDQVEPRIHYQVLK